MTHAAKPSWVVLGDVIPEVTFHHSTSQAGVVSEYQESGAPLLDSIIRAFAPDGRQAACPSAPAERGTPLVVTEFGQYKDRWLVRSALHTTSDAMLPPFILKWIPADPPEPTPGLVVMTARTAKFTGLTAAEVLGSKSGDSLFIYGIKHLPANDEPLWKSFAADRARLDRCILVIHVDSLRSAGIRLPEDVSLETVHEQLRGAMNNPTFARLLEAGHLVICYDRGLLHYANTTAQIAFRFSPHHRLHRRPTSGYMSGYTELFIALLGVRLLQENAVGADHARLTELIRECMDRAIKAGVKLLQGVKDDTHLGNRAKMLVEILKPFAKPVADADDTTVARTLIPAGFRAAGWHRLARMELSLSEHSARAFLYEVVRRGLDPLRKEVEKGNLAYPDLLDCPESRFGDLVTFDYREIDSLSAVANVLNKYLSDSSWKSPMNLAVFGQPGSGKSFAVRELIKMSAAGASPGARLECNLAQLTSPEQLTATFQQIQDRALSGEVPLVFFDEFDSALGTQQLGWLRFFLTPMQDGIFRAGDRFSALGRCVICFAGGVYDTYGKFEKECQDVGRTVKATDFVSRLHACLDIPGISVSHGTRLPFSVRLRRAMLLRAALEKTGGTARGPSGVYRVSPSIVRAFLEIPRYKHGVRSMESVVKQCIPTGRLPEYNASSLPGPALLELHVDSAVFLRLATDPLPG